VRYKVKRYAERVLIGEVAEAASLPSQTIRFYEREGLLPPPSRAANGYRVYDKSTLNRLRFIRSAQSAGLTLAEVRSIVDLRDDGDAPCGHVTELLRAKLEGVLTRKRELDRLAAELEHLLHRSESLDPGDCTDSEICHILAQSH